MILCLLGESTVHQHGYNSSSSDENDNTDVSIKCRKRVNNDGGDSTTTLSIKKKRLLPYYDSHVSSPQPGPSGLQSYNDSDSEDDNGQWMSHSIALDRRLAEKLEKETQYTMLIEAHIPRVDSEQIHECSSCYSSDSDESMSIDGFEEEEKSILRQCQVNLEDFLDPRRLCVLDNSETENHDTGMFFLIISISTFLLI